MEWFKTCMCACVRASATTRVAVLFVRELWQVVSWTTRPPCCSVTNLSSLACSSGSAHATWSSCATQLIGSVLVCQASPGQPVYTHLLFDLDTSYCLPADRWGGCSVCLLTDGTGGNKRSDSWCKLCHLKELHFCFNSLQHTSAIC